MLSYRDNLELEGYEVITAAEDGLAKAACRRRPDLVILDITLRATGSRSAASCAPTLVDRAMATEKVLGLRARRRRLRHQTVKASPSAHHVRAVLRRARRQPAASRPAPSATSRSTSGRTMASTHGARVRPAGCLHGRAVQRANRHKSGDEESPTTRTIDNFVSETATEESKSHRTNPSTVAHTCTAQAVQFHSDETRLTAESARRNRKDSSFCVLGVLGG